MVDHSKEFTKILSAGVRPELLVGNGINRDLLDLTRPKDDRSALQSDFCELMRGWKPAEHHRTIVRWAQKHRVPLLTVNFDENLSASIGAKLYRAEQKFTDYYPWGSYFPERQIRNPRDEFAIWHPHGMMKYSRSIRLGLIHYMGSVQRIHAAVFGCGL